MIQYIYIHYTYDTIYIYMYTYIYIYVYVYDILRYDISIQICPRIHLKIRDELPDPAGAKKWGPQKNTMDSWKLKSGPWPKHAKTLPSHVYHCCQTVVLVVSPKSPRILFDVSI